MLKASEIRGGNYIKHKSKIWKVISTSHVKPGKGGAYIQATLKSSKDGIKLEERFNSDENVEKIVITKKDCQFSYQEGNTVYLMDTENFETLEVNDANISADDLEMIKKFAVDEMILSLEYADEELIGISLPNSIAIKVELSDPVVKGQTAASSYKSAILVNGIKVAVPTYIEGGDTILINPYGEKGITFISRASKT